ncbi:MAG: hypothetical protein WCG16_06815 [Methylococcales bacterium]
MIDERMSLLNAEQLNSSCYCQSLNRKALENELIDLDGSGDLFRMIVIERPNLISDSAVFVSQVCLNQQLKIIAALEQVIHMPTYQEHVLSYAPESARFLPKASGVFVGYDFHLAPEGPKLIEINSNAGGALINALLIRAQKACCEKVWGSQPGRVNFKQTVTEPPEALFMTMFHQEWQAERSTTPLQRIAIIDDKPEAQYMLPEFILFKQLFKQHGLDAVICDPSELSYRDSAIWLDNLKIDLVYNRLTDFSLNEDKHKALREAYLAGDVVLTPHPRNHAIYADKRNLIWLCNDEFLQHIGVEACIRDILRQGIAHTVLVKANESDALWAARKKLFFKPAKGFGSKATYRGDKLTQQVFATILKHDYVAQALVKPSERQLEIDHGIVNFKLDLRHYVYRGETQLLCARLYQGQTTNFRTLGGGFAQIVVL